MKRFFVAIIILAMVFLASTVYAAWTVSPSVAKLFWGSGEKVYRIKVALTSDSSDPAEFNLSTYLTNKEYEGGRLYQIEIDPTVAPRGKPNNPFNISFDSETGADIIDLHNLSQTESKIYSVEASPAEIDFYPIVWDIQIDIDDIGATGDGVDIYLYLIK